MRQLNVTVTETTTSETLLSDLATGTARLHTEREDGTFRRVHFLADGTKEREVAEWVQDQREAGRTMRQIANEMIVSIPSVRRMINDLIITTELEEMDAEELAELLTGGEEVADTMVVTEALEDSPFMRSVAGSAE